jgi:hypothetical protein
MRDRIHDTAKWLAIVLGSMLFGFFAGWLLIRPAS